MERKKKENGKIFFFFFKRRELDYQEMGGSERSFGGETTRREREGGEGIVERLFRRLGEERGSFRYGSYAFDTSFFMVLPHFLESCLAGFTLCFTHLPDDLFCPSP